MSGHSHAANIAVKKAKTDAAKGKIFTKVGREISVAAKNNPDPETNSKLADAIAKAKAANMPNDNIQRSIKKASGEMNGADYKELTYEGYGVAGSAVIIVTLTDNINRTAGDVRAILGKHGGQLGQTGCVSYNFDNKGYIVVERTVELDEDTITEIALEAGADDVVASDDVYEIFTTPEAFSDVRKYLEEKNKRADKEHIVHVLRAGESMHGISQKYGIRLKNLYKLNKMNPDDPAPKTGTILRLR